jgi:hypothetical protein
LCQHQVLKRVRTFLPCLLDILEHKKDVTRMPTPNLLVVSGGTFQRGRSTLLQDSEAKS